jgi:hypothetical protein
VVPLAELPPVLDDPPVALLPPVAEDPPVALAELPPVVELPPVPCGPCPPVPCGPCPPVLVDALVVPTVEPPPVLSGTVEVSTTELDPPVTFEVSSPATPATDVVLEIPEFPPVSWVFVVLGLTSELLPQAVRRTRARMVELRILNMIRLI